MWKSFVQSVSGSSASSDSLGDSNSRVASTSANGEAVDAQMKGPSSKSNPSVSLEEQRKQQELIIQEELTKLSLQHEYQKQKITQKGIIAKRKLDKQKQEETKAAAAQATKLQEEAKQLLSCKHYIKCPLCFICWQCLLACCPWELKMPCNNGIIGGGNQFRRKFNQSDDDDES